MSRGKYIAPTVTTDGVIFQLIDNQLCVLLIKRARDPFRGSFALPGGYTAAGETTADSLANVLLRKAGIKVRGLKLIEQLYTFDSQASDPRGYAVSVSYLGLGKDLTPLNTPSTESPAFFPVTDLPPLAYDHHKIIAYAHRRLKSKINYTNAIYALLDSMFTISQLQAAYQAIVGHPLDKRNFRKKFLSLGLIKPTTELTQDGAHRPARLYRFNKPSLESLVRGFD